jgi:hypothetical protein
MLEGLIVSHRVHLLPEVPRDTCKELNVAVGQSGSFG